MRQGVRGGAEDTRSDKAVPDRLGRKAGENRPRVRHCYGVIVNTVSEIGVIKLSVPETVSAESHV
jgi:hypothetical protein